MLIAKKISRIEIVRKTKMKTIFFIAISRRKVRKKRVVTKASKREIPESRIQKADNAMRKINDFASIFLNFSKKKSAAMSGSQRIGPIWITVAGR